jgi:hypothetical protein
LPKGRNEEGARDDAPTKFVASGKLEALGREVELERKKR